MAQHNKILFYHWVYFPTIVIHQKTTFNAQYAHELYIDYILKSRFLANIIGKKYSLMSLHRLLNPVLSNLI